MAGERAAGIDAARAWLDGELDAEEFAGLEQRLRGPEGARDFLRALHFEQAVARVARAQVEGEVIAAAAAAAPVAGAQPGPTPAPSARFRRRRARAWAAEAGSLRTVAALLFAVLALGAAWWRFAPAPVVGTLVVNAGAAQLAGEAVALGESREVRSGALLELPAHAWSTLRFSDGSVVDLLDGTRVEVVVEQDGKRLVLAQGELHGDVRKQPPGRPLVIVTPRTRTTVIGTRLSVQGGAHERVAVDEGRVRVSRLSDQAEVQVGAGEAVEVPSAGALSVLRPARAVAEAPSVDGLQLWLDADRGIAADDQGLVWQWRDQGPLALHLSQPATDQQPRLLRAATGEHAAVSFARDEQWLCSTGRWPEFHSYTVAMLLRPTTLGTWSLGIGCGWGSFYFHSTTRGEVFTGVGAQGGGIRFTPEQLPAGTLRLGAWRRFAVTYSDSEGGGAVYVDGRQAGRIDMPRPAAWRNFRIGRQHPPPDEPRGFDGDIQEVLVYDRTLDGDEIERLDRHLRQRLESTP